MRKISFLLAVVPVLIVISACSSNSDSSKPQSIKSEDVVSMQVVGGLAGTKGSPLYLNSVQSGKTAINKIADWINSSERVDGQTEYGKHGYPMFIHLKMKDSTEITIEPAYKCISKSNSDGSGTKTCTPVKGEIVLSNPSHKFLLKSPELSELLKEGWKDY